TPPGTVRPANFDYDVSGMFIPKYLQIGTPYVDILAGQSYTEVTLTPRDDTTAEGTETAIFTVLPNANYEVGTPSASNIVIADNDSPAGVSLNATADAYVKDGTSSTSNFGSS